MISILIRLDKMYAAHSELIDVILLLIAAFLLGFGTSRMMMEICR